MSDRHATTSAGGAGAARPAPNSGAAPAASDLPADALAVRGILRSMGAEEAEPRVLAMLLDFVYTYAADVLQDAEGYAEALARPPGTVELGELSFAMQARGSHAFCQPPPQDVLQKLADEVRSVYVHGVAGGCMRCMLSCKKGICMHVELWLGMRVHCSCLLAGRCTCERVYACV